MLSGIMLLVAGWLGFMGNPVRTWKISAVLLSLLYAYLLYGFFSYQMYRHNMEFFLLIPGGVCSAVACAEIIMAWRQDRDVKWTLLRATLTICAVLTFAPMAYSYPGMFDSIPQAIRGLIISAVVVGPSACLAAALWTGLPRARGSTYTDSASG